MQDNPCLQYLEQIKQQKDKEILQQLMKKTDNLMTTQKEFKEAVAFIDGQLDKFKSLLEWCFQQEMEKEDIRFLHKVMIITYILDSIKESSQIHLSSNIQEDSTNSYVGVELNNPNLENSLLDQSIGLSYRQEPGSQLNNISLSAISSLQNTDNSNVGEEFNNNISIDLEGSHRESNIDHTIPSYNAESINIIHLNGQTQSTMNTQNSNSDLSKQIKILNLIIEKDQSLYIYYINLMKKATIFVDNITSPFYSDYYKTFSIRDQLTIASLFVQLKEFQRAKEMLQEIRNTNRVYKGIPYYPPTIDIIIMNLYKATNKKEEGFKWLLKIVQEMKNNKNIDKEHRMFTYRQLGQKYLIKKQYLKAYQYFTMAHYSKPKDYTVWKRALCLQHLDLYEEAASILKHKAVSKLPKTKAYFGIQRGWIESKRHNFQMAQQYYQQAYQHFYDHHHILNNFFQGVQDVIQELKISNEEDKTQETQNEKNMNNFKEMNNLILCRAMGHFEKLEVQQSRDREGYYQQLDDVSRQFDFFESYTEEDHISMTDVYIYRTKIELRKQNYSQAKQYWIKAKNRLLQREIQFKPHQTIIFLEEILKSKMQLSFQEKTDLLQLQTKGKGLNQKYIKDAKKLGEQYLMQKQYDLAKKAYSYALKISQVNPVFKDQSIIDNLLYCYMNTTEFGKMFELIDRSHVKVNLQSSYAILKNLISQTNQGSQIMIILNIIDNIVDNIGYYLDLLDDIKSKNLLFFQQEINIDSKWNTYYRFFINSLQNWKYFDIQWFLKHIQKQNQMNQEEEDIIAYLYNNDKLPLSKDILITFYKIFEKAKELLTAQQFLLMAVDMYDKSLQMYEELINFYLRHKKERKAEKYIFIFIAKLEQELGRYHMDSSSSYLKLCQWLEIVINIDVIQKDLLDKFGQFFRKIFGSVQKLTSKYFRQIKLYILYLVQTQQIQEIFLFLQTVLFRWPQIRCFQYLKEVCLIVHKQSYWGTASLCPECELFLMNLNENKNYSRLYLALEAINEEESVSKFKVWLQIIIQKPINKEELIKLGVFFNIKKVSDSTVLSICKGLFHRFRNNKSIVDKVFKEIQNKFKSFDQFFEYFLKNIKDWSIENQKFLLDFFWLYLKKQTVEKKIHYANLIKKYIPSSDLTRLSGLQITSQR